MGVFSITNDVRETFCNRKDGTSVGNLTVVPYQIDVYKLNKTIRDVDTTVVLCLSTEIPGGTPLSGLTY